MQNVHKVQRGKKATTDTEHLILEALDPSWARFLFLGLGWPRMYLKCKLKYKNHIKILVSIIHSQLFWKTHLNTPLQIYGQQKSPSDQVQISRIWGFHSSASHLLMLVPHSWIFLSWRWGRYIPPKQKFTQDLHGATSQKMAFFKWI
jgi:hypothetical protein